MHYHKHINKRRMNKILLIVLRIVLFAAHNYYSVHETAPTEHNYLVESLNSNSCITKTSLLSSLLIWPAMLVLNPQKQWLSNCA